MAPPANDDRAGAQLVPVGSYWGVVTGGTTVDATEDAGGPVDGFGAKDVFYYWSSLPAGVVYFYVEPKATSPDPGAYFEAYAFSGSPASWTSAEGLSGGGSAGEPGFTCRFQHNHTGGPLSLVVYTYDGDPSGDDLIFDFGWAHELDATPSHWSDEQEDPWDFKDNSDSFDLISIGGIGTRRGIKQTWYGLIPGSTPPPDASGHALCAFENARDGVYDYPDATVHTCSYIGPGPGTADELDAAAQMVGSYYVATAFGTITPTVTTGRGDQVGVEESVGAWNIDTDKFVGPIVKADHFPVDFTAYQTANDGPDDALVWGWQFVNDDWQTQNLNLGDITVSNAFDGSADATDTCTVTVRLIDPSMIYSDFATVFDNPNQVWLSPTNSDTAFSYILPADVSATEVVNLGSSGTTNLSYPDRTSVDSMLVAAPGDSSAHKRLVVAFLSEEALADTPPTFGDPTSSSDWVTVGNRSVNVTGTPGWEARLPTWRAFIGFELVPPTPSGWRVGRVAAGGTPW